MARSKVITAKVTTVGNSTGIVLPKEVLAKLRVAKGDELCFMETPDGFKITPYDLQFAEIMDAAEQVMREDRDVLRILAK